MDAKQMSVRIVFVGIFHIFCLLYLHDFAATPLLR